jgi:hypothetical protein
MEDIKGVYVLNLPDSSSTTNTDDWYLYKVRLNYDENTQIEQAAVMIYDEEYYLSTTLGDNSSDYDAVMFAFDTRWGTNKTANIKRVNNETSSNMHGELYYLYAETRACYNSTGSTDTICINNLKNKFEQYLECSYDSDFYFRDYMNSSSLDRLNDIQFDCN